MFLMALWTSSLAALTPRRVYLSLCDVAIGKVLRAKVIKYRECGSEGCAVKIWGRGGIIVILNGQKLRDGGMRHPIFALTHKNNIG